MNVYDFDNTIYDGESTFDFFFFCLRRRPKLISFVCPVVYHFARYRLCLVSREQLVVLADRYLTDLLRVCPDVESFVAPFWEKNGNRIKPYYLKQKKPDDVVLSASFRFLIRPMCEKLGIRHLICSEIDLASGVIGTLCFRENKPDCFDKVFPGASIDAFYTDSRNDQAMIARAKESYLVKKDRIIRIS